MVNRRSDVFSASYNGVHGVVHEVGQSVVVAGEHPSDPVSADPGQVHFGVAFRVARRAAEQEAILFLIRDIEPLVVSGHTVVVLAC